MSALETTDAYYELDKDNNIIDVLTGEPVQNTPEERVRQNYIWVLINDYGYPKNLIGKEIAIQSGRKLLLDIEGNVIRADIVVYLDKEACDKKDQGRINFVVECKKPTAKEGYTQLVSYIFNTSASGGVWTNGEEIEIYQRKTDGNQRIEETLDLPRYREGWDGDIIPSKADLPRPKNIRFLLATCHNKLYGRGMENADYDLTMDMVRILLAKIQDETNPGSSPEFWITKSEFKNQKGRHAAAERIRSLFRQYADQYPDVFDPAESIMVGDDCVVEAAGVLQNWSLAAKSDDADDWDLMGETYEQFTHINLKRQQGQYFTNRLVVDMIMSMLDPEVGDRMLDPAGGGGGFATAAFRFLRRKVIDSTNEGSAQRERQITSIKESVYLVEIASRLVKIAKCAMLLTGDGQSGMTRGNSLGPYDNLDPWILSHCRQGSTNAPNIIATNPPFSGQKIESQISDPEILKLFNFGHSYSFDAEGHAVFSDKPSDILARQAPELLFLERCLDWLKPGGRLGIVLPKGILDNFSYFAYRDYLLQRFQIEAVITLHKNTFQPDTGVRTCVLIIKKPLEGETPPTDYSIFMAQSQRIGRDSKGAPVFKLDEHGNNTSDLNYDLDDIAESFSALTKNLDFRESEYSFTTPVSELDANLNLNPQHYSPQLNAVLNSVKEFDNIEGWSTTTVGQLEADMKIYIGPRWKSSNLVVENPSDTSALTPYLTANAALELRRTTVKWFDTSLANAGQKSAINALRVNEGDILISRSGTIGKVTYATKDLADNYVISDDLVRIRVADTNLRKYLLAYFTSSTALSLMKIDEFGSVQQHLQPRHIQEMIIPIPDDWSQVTDVIKAGGQIIEAMEAMANADKNNSIQGFDALHQDIAVIQAE